MQSSFLALGSHPASAAVSVDAMIAAPQSRSFPAIFTAEAVSSEAGLLDETVEFNTQADTDGTLLIGKPFMPCGIALPELDKDGKNLPESPLIDEAVNLFGGDGVEEVAFVNLQPLAPLKDIDGKPDLLAADGRSLLRNAGLEGADRASLVAGGVSASAQVENENLDSAVTSRLHTGMAGSLRKEAVLSRSAGAAAQLADEVATPFFKSRGAAERSVRSAVAVDTATMLAAREKVQNGAQFILSEMQNIAPDGELASARLEAPGRNGDWAFGMPIREARGPAGTPLLQLPNSAVDDLTRIVECLVASREAAKPPTPMLTLDHAEFGKLSLRFEHQQDGRLTFGLSAGDAETHRAVVGALAVDRGNTTGSNNNNEQGENEPTMPHQNSGQTHSGSDGNANNYSSNSHENHVLLTELQNDLNSADDGQARSVFA